MTILELLNLFLTFVHGALVGSFVTMIWLWWQLATGRRTVRPWPFK